MSRISIDAHPTHQAISPFGSSPKLGSKPSICKFMQDYHGKKRVSIRNILGLNKGCYEKFSIHDSDIDNCNQIILRRAQVIYDCHDLGILFQENEEQVDKYVVKILNNEN